MAIDYERRIAERDQRIAELEQQLAERTRDLAEARQQQTATADVLRIISQSPAELQTVLEAIAEKAARVCGAEDALIRLREGETLAMAAHVGPVSDAPALVPIQRDTPGGRAVLERRTIHLPDLAAPDAQEFGSLLAFAPLQRGIRTMLCAPLLRGNEAVGSITIRRTEVNSFTDSQIQALEAFADQAVIAIQNARLFQELAEKSRQLEEVSRHKSEFLANMSHELRTPLNGIIGFSEILLNPDMPVDDETRQQFLTNIYESGQHLLNLINDILDLSKVEAGKMELHPEAFALREALQSVHAVVRALADRKRQFLSLKVPDEPVLLYHDPGRFKQVLFNLLSNAVKFTPEGGSVTTTAVVDDGRWLEVAVKDTGIGIAPEDQSRVFEEFQQIDSGYGRQQRGTGLGLALARNFVRLMGGDITLQSAPGEGSTFTVRLPVRGAERLAAEAAGPDVAASG